MFRHEALERLPLRVIAACAVLVCVAGVVIGVAASTPANLIDSVAVGAFLHDLHGSAGVALLSVVVLVLASAIPRRSRALGAAMLVAALVSFVPMLPGIPESARTPALSATLAATAVVALAVTRHGLRQSGFDPRNVGLALAALSQLFAAIALCFTATPGVTLGDWVVALLVGALGALAQPAPDEEPRVLTSAGLVLLVILVHVPAGDGDVRPALLGFAQLVLGLALVGAVFVGRARRFPFFAARLAAVHALLLVALALGGRAFYSLGPMEAHLHDTLFVVALGHAAWLALLTAALAEWLRAREPRPGLRLRHAPALGVAAAGAGALVFVWAHVRLGLDGMPRAYLRYVEVFTAGHVVAAIAAVLFGLGMATVVTTTRRRHEQAAAEEVFS